ncbi:hypothetical protein GCM10009801_12570 [Streptomyces albiaxialis]|uniref:Peptidase S9 prolyl oligopeptidase catalytic domain-containing protein n=1 Tax=Streptomyces albiaxialis TaxID=329523 RepID=A0ABP5H9M3_9ACTN
MRPAHHLRSRVACSRGRLAHNWHRFVGDPNDPAQEAGMPARSPAGRLDRPHVPLLVVQGADVRVAKGESDRLVEVLRLRGTEVEYLVKEGVGHSFVNPESQLDVHHTVRRFLARHLGGEPSASSVRRADAGCYRP